VSAASIAPGALNHNHNMSITRNESVGYMTTGTLEQSIGCPGATLLVSGGCRVGSGLGTITRSLIYNNEWYCQVRSDDGLAVTFSVLAHCLTIAPATLP
jgi:hypothetical protein